MPTLQKRWPEHEAHVDAVGDWRARGDVRNVEGGCHGVEATGERVAAPPGAPRGSVARPSSGGHEARGLVGVVNGAERIAAGAACCAGPGCATARAPRASCGR